MSARLPALLSLLLTLGVSSPAQNSWFQPSLLNRPEIKKAMHSIDDRTAGIVDEWVTVTEIPSPSGKETARARYIQTEMQKLGFSEVHTDAQLNVSGVRKGTGGGPSVVFAAHTDTVFPEGTNLKVKREPGILRAPGVADDTGNLIATLEMFRALNRAGIETKGDLIFLASSQEEIGLVGAKFWLENSGYKPDMFVAVDLSNNAVWYGALRVAQLKFFYSSPGAHTLESRGAPSPARAVAKAIEAVYAVPLPPIAEGLGAMKLPTLNVGMLGGGTVFNAIPREAWFTVDLRSMDNVTQDNLLTAVVSAARRVAESERLGFRFEHGINIDYSKARPREERLNHGLVQTALAVMNAFQKPGLPPIRPTDVGSNDSNIAISMGIPAVALGTTAGYMPHRLEEYADSNSIIPGIKALIALAVSLTTH